LYGVYTQDAYIAAFSDGSEALQLNPIVIILFKFVAALSLFEFSSIIFSCAIEGVGGTNF
jgi:hypothetical protein